MNVLCNWQSINQHLLNAAEISRLVVSRGQDITHLFTFATLRNTNKEMSVVWWDLLILKFSWRFSQSRKYSLFSETWFMISLYLLQLSKISMMKQKFHSTDNNKKQSYLCKQLETFLFLASSYFSFNLMSMSICWRQLEKISLWLMKIASRFDTWQTGKSKSH